MATTPEGKVKTAIKSVLKDEGVYYFMPRGTLLGRRGVSDFICCVNGKFLAIEAKAGANKLAHPDAGEGCRYESGWHRPCDQRKQP